MTAPRKRRIKVAAANVQLHRNGLTFEMQGVPADAMEAIGTIMLDAMRSLTKKYPELVPDAGSVHASPLGEVSDDDAYVETRRVGFR